MKRIGVHTHTDLSRSCATAFCRVVNEIVVKGLMHDAQSGETLVDHVSEKMELVAVHPDVVNLQNDPCQTCMGICSYWETASRLVPLDPLLPL